MISIHSSFLKGLPRVKVMRLTKTNPFEKDDDYKHYTYTIITTSSSKQLSFLHDRMPVILENGSDEVRTWLDPSRHEWSAELQALLRPFGEGERDGEGESGGLEIYPVSKDVGKVGNNSPTFIIPIDSRENKNNIANFFTSKTGGGGGGGAKGKKEKKTVETKKDVDGVASPDKKMMKTEHESQPEIEMTTDKGFIAGDEDNHNHNHNHEPQLAPIKREPSPSPSQRTATTATTTPLKRRASDTSSSQPPLKKERLDDSPEKTKEEDEEEKKEEEKPPPRTTTTTPSKAATSDNKPTFEQTTPATKAPPPKTTTTTSRPKISATSNRTKKTPPSKNKNPGTQKITKFFGNSA